MLPSSKKLLEGLLYVNPSLLSIYKLIDLNRVSSVEHKEYNNILSHFTNPQVLIAIGITSSCFIIQREKKQTYHVIEIGAETSYAKTSSGKLKQRIMEIVKQKDFVPQPMAKKLVFVGEYNKKEAEGEIYLEKTPSKYIHSEPKDDGVVHTYKPQQLVQFYLKGLPLES